jgi:hypothetical protein
MSDVEIDKREGKAERLKVIRAQLHLKKKEENRLKQIAGVVLYGAILILAIISVSDGNIIDSSNSNPYQGFQQNSSESKILSSIR